MKKLVLISLATIGILSTSAFAQEVGIYLDVSTKFQSGSNTKIYGGQSTNELIGKGGMKNSLELGYAIEDWKLGAIYGYGIDDNENSFGLAVTKKFEMSSNSFVKTRGFVEIGEQSKSSEDLSKGSTSGGTAVPFGFHGIAVAGSNYKANFEKNPQYFGYGLELAYGWNLTKNLEATIGYEFEMKEWDAPYRITGSSTLNSGSFDSYNNSLKIGLAYKF